MALAPPVLSAWLLSAPPERNPAELERDAPSAVDSSGDVAEAVELTITAVDLVGVFFFAVSGAVLAVRKGYDLVGSLLLALLVGIGGGVVRDLIVNADVPSAFTNPIYLLMPMLAAALVFFRLVGNTRDENAVMVFDAIGLSVYCVLGTRIALLGGLDPLPAALLGLATAIGGGMMRDVAAGEPPAVFGGPGWYAIPALLGAGATATLGALEWLTMLSSLPIMAVVLTLRLVSLKRQWIAPGAEITGRYQRQRLTPGQAPPIEDVRDREGTGSLPAVPGDQSEDPEGDPPADAEHPGSENPDDGPRTSGSRPA